MKLVKSLALGALALASVGSSYAYQIKVTGSTAFRAALYSAVVDQLQTGGHTVTAAYVGSSLAKANQVVFVSNDGNIVQTCMAGSVGGVKWVSENGNPAVVAPFVTSGSSTYANMVNRAWIKSTVTKSAVTLSGTAVTGGSQLFSSVNDSTATTNFEAAAPADFCMSDSLQSSTPYTATTLVSAGAAGVVQFTFAKGDATGLEAGVPGANANFKNVTALQFQALASAGAIHLSQFTGNAADETAFVILAGRDVDSGTRLVTAFEGGLNNVNAYMSQSFLQNASNQDLGTATVTDYTISQFVSAGAVGNEGYSSGGSIQKVLSYKTDATGMAGVIVLGYMGLSDRPLTPLAANGSIPSSGTSVDTAKLLSFNGVMQSDVATQEGAYSFWSYEQGYYRTGNANGATITSIVGKINATYAPAAGGLLISTMKCQRSSEGAVINSLL